MAFSSDLYVGIEDYPGATNQLLFDDPPIILDRFHEGGPGVAVNRSLSNEPVVVEYASDQTDVMLAIRLRKLTWTQVQALHAHVVSGGLKLLKITPGTSTTSIVAFAPATEHEWNPYSGEHGNAKKDGTAFSSFYGIYSVDVTFVILG